MKLPLSNLPRSVFERLKKVQATPQEYAGYYIREGGKGWAIFGIMLALGALAMSYLMAQDGTVIRSLAGWIIGMIVVLWIFFASIDHIRRYNRGSLKPFLFLNPLYLTRVNLDEVFYYNIPTELTDFKRTDNYNNGAYTGSTFAFTFKNGAESVTVSPIAKADELSETLKSFSEYLSESIDKQDFQSLASHDLFFEVEELREKGELRSISIPNQGAPKKWRNFTLALVLGAVLGGGFNFFELYSLQKRQLSTCRSALEYERFLTKYSPNFFEEKAQEGLFSAYEKQLIQSKQSANKLRKLLTLKKLPLLPKNKETEILDLYKMEGSQALLDLYKKAIAKYTTRSKEQGNFQAKKVMLDILQGAKDRGLYKVKVQYFSTIKSQKEKGLATKFQGKPIVPMGPSFRKKDNLRRESYITSRIQQSFGTIIPQDILSFGKEGDILFKISYTIYPSKMLYITYSTLSNPLGTTKGNVKKYYRGIQIIWKFEIFQGKKRLYAFVKRSTPPSNFKLHKKTLYDRMAETAFDNFGKQLVNHFGIPSVSANSNVRQKPYKRKYYPKNYLDKYKKYRKKK